LQAVLDLLSDASYKQNDLTDELDSLPDAAVDAMLAAFTYLQKLGLNVWNEIGLRLRPMSSPGHMVLGSNALHNLHILSGVLPDHEAGAVTSSETEAHSESAWEPADMAFPHQESNHLAVQERIRPLSRAPCCTCWTEQSQQQAPGSYDSGLHIHWWTA
jgi:hypothetical protein